MFVENLLIFLPATSITISNSVTTVGDMAFYWCTALTSIDVENANANYSSIDGVLFDKEKTILIWYPAKKTNSSYVVPNSVTTIGDYAFMTCTVFFSRVSIIAFSYRFLFQRQINTKIL